MIQSEAPKGPKVQNQAAEQAAISITPSFSWSTHPVKLNRAKAWVMQNPEMKDLKGKAFEEAVKARYVEMKGLLATDKPVRSQKNNGRVMNVADDDGSKD